MSGNQVVVNTRVEAARAAALLRPILAEQANERHRVGDARQLTVVLRHSDLTYRDVYTTLDSIDSGAWPGGGKGRFRTLYPDYPAQQLIVEMVNATDTDQQWANRTFGGEVRVVVSYQIEVPQAGVDVVTAFDPARP